jgi:hypothetical protein
LAFGVGARRLRFVGFLVNDLRFGVKGSGFSVYVQGSRFTVWGLGIPCFCMLHSDAGADCMDHRPCTLDTESEIYHLPEL